MVKKAASQAQQKTQAQKVQKKPLAPHYLCEFHGEFCFKKGSEKGFKTYRIKVRVPARIPRDHLTHFVKNKILPKLLKNNDKSFVRLRTYYIDDVEMVGMEKSYGKDFNSFTRLELEAFIKINNINIKSAEVVHLQDLRDLIRVWRKEPTRFPEFYRNILARQAEESELAELNEDMIDNNFEVDVAIEQDEIVGDFSSEEAQLAEDVFNEPEDIKKDEKVEF
jgi:hypothetical protein